MRALSARVELAAHVLGYVGEISDEQLATRRDAGYQEGDTIGKDGAERAFEKELRGKPRREKVEVDPTGKPVGAPLDVDPGTIGNDVKLTIDAKLAGRGRARAGAGHRVRARRSRTRTSRTSASRTLKAPGGAVVAMDVHRRLGRRDGVAPQLRPSSQFVDGISQTEWSTLNDNPRSPAGRTGSTQGQYAPGSTFKLVSVGRR